MSRRGRRDAARGSRVGADDVLDAVVAQFTDPLTLLRELVQNSLDASATRIEVGFSYDRDRERMAIAVVDNGEGMNQRIIDDHLLTLFSSSKEDDLTKIGKFGIGFLSIFAIEPDLVVVETGQAGESWRILFHRDRSFEKLRRDEPVEGTAVTLYKAVPPGEFARVRAAGTATVRRWCKYAEADIRVDGAPIAERFGVEAGLALVHEQPGTSVAVGFAGNRPLIGFYNRGLTLIEGDRLPHDGAGDLAGLSLRVKSRYLEHTLTRDNVRQDENYGKAIDIARDVVRERLRPRLIAHLEQLAAGADLDALGRALAWAQLPSMLLHRERNVRLVPTVEAGPVTVGDLSGQPWPDGRILYAQESSPLTRLLAKQGCTVVRHDARGVIVGFLRACDIEPADAHARLYTAAGVAREEHDADLLQRVGELLDALGADDVHFGDFDYPGSPVSGRLHVRQRTAFGLSPVAEKDDRPGTFGGPRQVVLAGSHPLVADCRAIAADHPELAALLLAEGIAMAEGIAAGYRAELVERSLAAHRRRHAAAK